MGLELWDTIKIQSWSCIQYQVFTLIRDSSFTIENQVWSSVWFPIGSSVYTQVLEYSDGES